jgi:Fungal specific transcription factor domain
MLDMFIQRFVDAFSPEVDASSGHAGALRAGAEIRMFSPLISSAYDAVSLTFFGRSVKDPRIEAAGMKLYPKVLRSLQDALLDPERSRSESTLVTVTLLLAFESIERTSDAGVLAHVRGAAQLIQHRGPENHVYGVEHLLFTELRPYWVGVALVDRKPSFMAEDIWKTVPWSAETTKKDLLHYLTDLVVEIPALLGEHDDLATTQESQILGRGELRAKQARLWNGISDLTLRFLQWKKENVDCYPGGPVKEARTPQGSDPFPVFRCRDLRSMEIIEPPPLVYPDLRLLQTMCFYYSSRLILSSIDDRPEGAIGMAEKYYLACGIARSLEDYLRRAPGNMINRLAFSTRVAWEAFPAGGVEREFMAEVFNLVEKRHSLRLWGSFMPELSAQGRST